MYVEKLSPFSLPSFPQSILALLLIYFTLSFNLGLHAHYSNHKNKEDFLLTLYKVYKETVARITVRPVLNVSKPSH